jgi:hypothetical protein
VSGEGIVPPAPTVARWVKAVLFAAGTFLGLLVVTLVAALCCVGACPRDDQLRLALFIFFGGVVVGGALAKYVFRRTLRSSVLPTDGHPTQGQVQPS